MPSTSALVWGMVFGAIGTGYFVYGKKQSRVASLLSGIALIAVPYLIADSILLVAAGVLLMALPFFWKA